METVWDNGGGEIVAEFSEVMKQLARMANACNGKCGKCPLGNSALCNGRPWCFGNKEGIAEAERIVMQWAAEHPEPVYPSIAKYFKQFGITIRRDGSLEADYFKANEPMSADMAKLLGISSGDGENEKTD